MKRFAIILVCCALLAGGGYALSASFGSKEHSRYEIETATVTTGTVSRVVNTTGTIGARLTVEIGSQLSGQISEVGADFNDSVAADQVIARIDPAPYEMRVAQAEAELAAAEANLSLQQATAERARVDQSKAQRDYERTRTLRERGTVSVAALDDAETAIASAGASLRIAEAQIASARAQVEQRRAALENSRIDLGHTYIRSPIDGIVIQRAVESGQTVAASLQAPVLFEIAESLESIEIEAQIDEADIGQVSQGNGVTFDVDAYPGQPFTGTVEQIRLSPTIDQNVVTYTVIISAQNPQSRLLPGMTANLRILTGEEVDVPVLPNAALRFQPGDDLGAIVTAAPEAEAARENAAANRHAAIRQALESVLTPAQVSALDLDEADGSGVRASTATVWLLDGAERLVPRQVRLGLSDAQQTQVVFGVAPGDRVVLRARARTS